MTAGSVSVWVNDGTGLFSQSATLGMGVASDVGADDLDGDGFPDLLVINANGVHTVYTGNGSGGFAAHPVSIVAPGADSLTFTDIDGDGVMDVILGTGTGGGSRVYRNSGSGNLAAVAEVDLDVQLSGPSATTVGSVFQQTVTVSNMGAAPAESVVVVFEADGLGMRNAVTSSSGTCIATATTVTCDIPVIAAGAEVTISIPVVPVANGSYQPQASASTRNYNRKSVNNQKSTQITATQPVVRPANQSNGDGDGDGGGGGANGLLSLTLISLLALQRRRRLQTGL